MKRVITKIRPLSYGMSLFPFAKEDPDKISEESFRALYNEAPPESGWNRVKSIFYIDEFDNFSHEANYVFQSTMIAAFVGTIYGGISQSRIAYIKFMENNHATAFESTFEAQRKIQDKITVALGKGAWKWGWRLSLFTFSFTSLTTILSAYRGDTSISDYVISGFCTGILYKLNTGVRGSIVGGVVGLCLGTICGTLTVGLLKISGTSMDDVKHWQLKFTDSRKKYHDMAIENASKEKNFKLEGSHDQMVAERAQK